MTTKTDNSVIGAQLHSNREYEKVSKPHFFGETRNGHPIYYGRLWEDTDELLKVFKRVKYE